MIRAVVLISLALQFPGQLPGEGLTGLAIRSLDISGADRPRAEKNR